MKRLIILSLLTLSSAFGYITQTLSTGGQNYTIKRANATDMTYYLNDQVTTSLTSGGKSVFSPGSNPAAAAQAAIAAWNSVSTANIHFNAVTSTSTVHDASDCKNVIAFASSPGDITAVGGALAVTMTAYSVSGPVCGGSTDATPGTIYDADIVFSPAIAFSTDKTANTIDFQSVLTHELGHSMGANHSEVVGSTMFWNTSFNQYNQRRPSSDDIGFVSSVYPAASANPGTLRGAIGLPDGSPVKYGLVTAIDRTAGTTYGALTGADGAFSITVPAGSYIVYAEPFNTFISNNNIYTTTGALDAGQVTTGYLPTFLGGAATPTATTVTAGATATMSLTVTTGTSSLTPPFYGVGVVGGAGDISGSLPGMGPAITLASGQSFDLGFVGGGIDDATTFLIFGRGISIRAGSLHSDPKIGVPLRRFTLDIPAQTDTTLASLWIVKGTDVLAYTGGLVITPPTPVVNGVQDAESGRKAFTSGQWVAIYGSNLGGTSRTWATADFTGGTAPGSPLPSSLDGVSVTINGAPASIYLVTPLQLNVLAPSNLPAGPVSVVVTNQGASSAPFQGTVVQASPSFFY